jgi:DNA-binding transcriptional LysR family regulator
MNLRQLEAFRATFHQGSITRAAAYLHISQPSVSRLIGDLETSVGFNLFTRTGHGLRPTPEARRFHQTVDSMFLGLDKLRETADAISNARDEVVSLASIPVIARSAMPKALKRVRENGTPVGFDIAVRNTPEIVDAVSVQQLDLGVICPVRHYDGVDILFETRFTCQCLLPEEHRLANDSGAIDLSQLIGEECMMLDQDYLKQAVDDADILNKLRKDSKIVTKSSPAMMAIARTLRLPAIVDPFTSSLDARPAGFITRSIQQRIEYPVAIITPMGINIPLLARRYADALIEELDYSARQA